MELKEAVKILKDHNAWRRDKEDVVSMKCTIKDLGIAIDVIVDHLSD